MSLPISFLSDFGTVDEFVGVVHGVIARIAPDSRVIDVTHHIPQGDVRAGALALMRAVQYLPEGVALAVVDPGVGTSRRALAAQTAWGVFVGPDNGLLSPAVAMVGGASHIVSIEHEAFRIPAGGTTFEGRDRFAPAAAVLATGEASMNDLGPPVDPAEVVPLLLPLPDVEPDGVSGVAWWIDGFGNVQTNIGPEEMAAVGLVPGSAVEVRLGARSFGLTWVTTYADAAEGEALVHVDSYGLVALAVRNGRADEELGIVGGMGVRLGPGST